MMPYERFRAWEKCHELALAVYRATRTWPKEEQYSLTAQARRAAYSAAANIAEGSARRGPREFRRFLDISLGSLSELAYVFRLGRDLELRPAREFESLEDLRQSAGKLAWRLHEAVKKRMP